LHFGWAAVSTFAFAGLHRSHLPDFGGLRVCACPGRLRHQLTGGGEPVRRSDATKNHQPPGPVGLIDEGVVATDFVESCRCDFLRCDFRTEPVTGAVVTW
jgi:hypothetical protein